MRARVQVVTGQRRRMSEWARLWCALAHPDVTWPINGRYRCRTCHRVYRVPWELPAMERAEGAGKVGRVREVRQPAPLAA